MGIHAERPPHDQFVLHRRIFRRRLPTLRAIYQRSTSLTRTWLEYWSYEFTILLRSGHTSYVRYGQDMEDCAADGGLVECRCGI
jgi:hypothetical protein